MSSTVILTHSSKYPTAIGGKSSKWDVKNFIKKVNKNQSAMRVIRNKGGPRKKRKTKSSSKWALKNFVKKNDWKQLITTQVGNKTEKNHLPKKPSTAKRRRRKWNLENFVKRPSLRRLHEMPGPRIHHQLEATNPVVKLKPRDEISKRRLLRYTGLTWRQWQEYYRRCRRKEQHDTRTNGKSNFEEKKNELQFSESLKDQKSLKLTGPIISMHQNSVSVAVPLICSRITNESKNLCLRQGSQDNNHCRNKCDSRSPSYEQESNTLKRKDTSELPYRYQPPVKKVKNKETLALIVSLFGPDSESECAANEMSSSRRKHANRLSLDSAKGENVDLSQPKVMSSGSIAIDIISPHHSNGSSTSNHSTVIDSTERPPVVDDSRQKFSSSKNKSTSRDAVNHNLEESYKLHTTQIVCAEALIKPSFKECETIVSAKVFHEKNYSKSSENSTTDISADKALTSEKRISKSSYQSTPMIRYNADNCLSSSRKFGKNTDGDHAMCSSVGASKSFMNNSSSTKKNSSELAVEKHNASGENRPGSSYKMYDEKKAHSHSFKSRKSRPMKEITDSNEIFPSSSSHRRCVSQFCDQTALNHDKENLNDQVESNEKNCNKPRDAERPLKSSPVLPPVTVVVPLSSGHGTSTFQDALQNILEVPGDDDGVKTSEAYLLRNEPAPNCSIIVDHPRIQNDSNNNALSGLQSMETPAKFNELPSISESNSPPNAYEKEAVSGEIKHQESNSVENFTPTSQSFDINENLAHRGESPEGVPFCTGGPEERSRSHIQIKIRNPEEINKSVEPDLLLGPLLKGVSDECLVGFYDSFMSWNEEVSSHVYAEHYANFFQGLKRNIIVVSNSHSPDLSRADMVKIQGQINNHATICGHLARIFAPVADHEHFALFVLKYLLEIFKVLSSHLRQILPVSSQTLFKYFRFSLQKIFSIPYFLDNTTKKLKCIVNNQTFMQSICRLASIERKNATESVHQTHPNEVSVNELYSTNSNDTESVGDRIYVNSHHTLAQPCSSTKEGTNQDMTISENNMLQSLTSLNHNSSELSKDETTSRAVVASLSRDDIIDKSGIQRHVAWSASSSFGNDFSINKNINENTLGCAPDNQNGIDRLCVATHSSNGRRGILENILQSQKVSEPEKPSNSYDQKNAHENNSRSKSFIAKASVNDTRKENFQKKIHDFDAPHRPALNEESLLISNTTKPDENLVALKRLATEKIGVTVRPCSAPAEIRPFNAPLLQPYHQQSSHKSNNINPLFNSVQSISEAFLGRATDRRRLGSENSTGSIVSGNVPSLLRQRAGEVQRKPRRTKAQIISDKTSVSNVQTKPRRKKAQIISDKTPVPNNQSVTTLVRCLSTTLNSYAANFQGIMSTPPTNINCQLSSVIVSSVPTSYSTNDPVRDSYLSASGVGNGFNAISLNPVLTMGYPYNPTTLNVNHDSALTSQNSITGLPQQLSNGNVFRGNVIAPALPSRRGVVANHQYGGAGEMSQRNSLVQDIPRFSNLQQMPNHYQQQMPNLYQHPPSIQPAVIDTSPLIYSSQLQKCNTGMCSNNGLQNSRLSQANNHWAPTLNHQVNGTRRKASSNIHTNELSCTGSDENLLGNDVVTADQLALRGVQVTTPKLLRPQTLPTTSQLPHSLRRLTPKSNFSLKPNSINCSSKSIVPSTFSNAVGSKIGRDVPESLDTFIVQQLLLPVTPIPSSCSNVVLSSSDLLNARQSTISGIEETNFNTDTMKQCLTTCSASTDSSNQKSLEEVDVPTIHINQVLPLADSDGNMFSIHVQTAPNFVPSSSNIPEPNSKATPTVEHSTGVPPSSVSVSPQPVSNIPKAPNVAKSPVAVAENVTNEGSVNNSLKPLNLGKVNRKPRVKYTQCRPVDHCRNVLFSNVGDVQKFRHSSSSDAVLELQPSTENPDKDSGDSPTDLQIDLDTDDCSEDWDVIPAARGRRAVVPGNETDITEASKSGKGNNQELIEILCKISSDMFCNKDYVINVVKQNIGRSESKDDVLIHSSEQETTADISILSGSKSNLQLADEVPAVSEKSKAVSTLGDCESSVYLDSVVIEKDSIQCSEQREDGRSKDSDTPMNVAKHALPALIEKPPTVSRKQNESSYSNLLKKRSLNPMNPKNSSNSDRPPKSSKSSSKHSEKASEGQPIYSVLNDCENIFKMIITAKNVAASTVLHKTKKITNHFEPSSKTEITALNTSAGTSNPSSQLTSPETVLWESLENLLNVTPVEEIANALIEIFLESKDCTDSDRALSGDSLLEKTMEHFQKHSKSEGFCKRLNHCLNEFQRQRKRKVALTLQGAENSVKKQLVQGMENEIQFNRSQDSEASSSQLTPPPTPIDTCSRATCKKEILGESYHCDACSSLVVYCSESCKKEDFLENHCNECERDVF